MISIINAYSIRNCLPYDLNLNIKKTKEKFVLKKNDSVFLDYVSTKENLLADIEFNGFKNETELCIFDYKNVTINKFNKI